MFVILIVLVVLAVLVAGLYNSLVALRTAPPAPGPTSTCSCSGGTIWWATWSRR